LMSKLMSAPQVRPASMVPRQGPTRVKSKYPPVERTESHFEGAARARDTKLENQRLLALRDDYPKRRSEIADLKNAGEISLQLEKFEGQVRAVGEICDADAGAFDLERAFEASEEFERVGSVELNGTGGVERRHDRPLSVHRRQAEMLE